MRRFFAWRILSANGRRRANASICCSRKPYLVPAGAEQASDVLERQCMLIHPEIREFTSTDFHSLAGIEESVCLSMFVPNAGGDQAALAHSKPALKDLLRQADDALRATGVQPAEVCEWLAPLENLLASTNRRLWRRDEPGGLGRCASPRHGL
jgi:hypothetical protein